MTKNYIYGASGHAKVIADAAGLQGIQISGFIDDFSHDEGQQFLGRKVYKKTILSPGDNVFLGFGNNEAREMVGHSLLAEGVCLPNLIHPSAIVAKNVKLGRGIYIGAGAVVDPDCIVGDFCILNNMSCLCHETVVGMAAHICPMSVCAGNVSIGARVWVGLGSRVIEKITIADDVFIGAGSVVVSDIVEKCLIYGIPAKPKKSK
jgi:sugar O-acyltransferase (sialic acid O-acetyltransferase NeuD family)